MSVDGEWKVVGMESDGTLICREVDAVTDENDWNCGETLEEFGIENLLPEERKLLNIPS
jgi:hypothetical protein